MFEEALISQYASVGNRYPAKVTEYHHIIENLTERRLAA